MRCGHDVVFAVRDTGSRSAEAAAARGGRLVAPADTADADVFVLAVPWTSVDDSLASLGDLTGKIVVDATNPVGPPFTGLDVAGSDSGAEVIQRAQPTARVVKAFNQTGWENMADPTAFTDGKPVMFVAGDNADARSTVMELASGLGFEAIDAGALSMSRYLEPLAMLWIVLANAQGLGTRFALSVIRR
jgi:predicted dinucleotide-binding enzyme